MKKVYVVLSCTGTGPSQLIKMATKAPFTHASIALVPCRHRLYSFARRRMHNIFIAGFFHEDVDKFVFAKFPNAPCAVYEVPVSDEGYKRMQGVIDACNKKYNKYKYSFFGAATTRMGIQKKLKYRYTCSQFVATVLDVSGDVSLPKHPSLMLPSDFAELPSAKLVYTGELQNIHFGKKRDTVNAL